MGGGIVQPTVRRERKEGHIHKRFDFTIKDFETVLRRHVRHFSTNLTRFETPHSLLEARSPVVEQKYRCNVFKILIKSNFGQIWYTWQAFIIQDPLTQREKKWMKDETGIRKRQVDVNF